MTKYKWKVVFYLLPIYCLPNVVQLLPMCCNSVLAKSNTKRFLLSPLHCIHIWNHTLPLNIILTLTLFITLTLILNRIFILTLILTLKFKTGGVWADIIYHRFKIRVMFRVMVWVTDTEIGLGLEWYFIYLGWGNLRVWSYQYSGG